MFSATYIENFLNYKSMYTKLSWLYLTLVFSIFSLSSTLANDIAYIDNLKTAKTMAASEGKLILVDFTAKWCTNCKMLEEYTLSNPDVAEYIKNHYLAVKINVDDFDGMDLKNQYKIGNLPTLMVMDSKGVLINRHEGNMTASKMLEYLELHHKLAGKAKPSSANSSFSTAAYVSKPNLEAAKKRNETYISSKPLASPNTKNKKIPTTPTVAPAVAVAPTASSSRYAAPAVSASKSKVAKNNVAGSTGAVKKSSTAASSSPKSKPAVGSNITIGNESRSVVKMPTKGYTVQVGCFKSEKELKAFSEKLKKLDFKAKGFRTTDDNGDTIYKVWVGQFESRSQATKFKSKLTKKGIKKSFVVSHDSSK
jgi:thioredoxin-related protein